MTQLTTQEEAHIRTITKKIPVWRCQLVRETAISVEHSAVTSPRIAYEFARPYFDNLDREHFAILLLNTKNKIVGFSVVSIGSLTSSVVHPREAFKPALLASAAGIILLHNHPSGDPEPSKEDIEVTARLCRAGEIMGIPVQDHLIIGDGCYVSLREQMLLP